MATATIPEVLAKIEHDKETKRDYIANTAALGFDRERGMFLPKAQEYMPMLPLAHDQLATHYKIPREYYGRLRNDHPMLLEDTVNYFFEHQPGQRLIRTLDGNVRAFLSNRYMPRDNYDLMVNAVLPTVQKMPDAQIMDLQLTETRLYAKIVLPRVQGEIRRGDFVQAGFLVTNSEVGLGRFLTEVFLLRLECLNGMVSPVSFGRRHVGRRAAETEEAYEVYSDATLAADDRAFWLKARDVIAAAANETTFLNIVKQMQEMAGTEPMQDPREGVDRLVKQYGFRDTEGESIYRHLLEGGDLTAYGALNAITRSAQDVESYDRRVEMERIGGRLLEMSERDWLAVAA